MSRNVLDYCSRHEALQLHIQDKDIIDHTTTAMDSMKSDKSRLESLRAQTQNQEKSMERMKALK